MNSRQSLPTNKKSATGFIYKPGFIDDGSLELIKMAVDKELSLISNCFYITAESDEAKFLSMKGLLDSMQSIIELLNTSVGELETQLATANSNITDLTTRVEALESKP